MASPKRDMLKSYERLQLAEAERLRLLPERLQRRPLVADPEWIEAVAARSQAFEEFVKTAREACDSWQTQRNDTPS